MYRIAIVVSDHTSVISCEFSFAGSFFSGTNILLIDEQEQGKVVELAVQIQPQESCGAVVNQGLERLVKHFSL